MLKIKGYYRIRILDKDGREVRRTRWRRSRSFVQAFLLHIHCMFARGLEGAIIDTGGDSRSVRYPNSIAGEIMGVRALVNVTTYGTLVGTGDTAVANTDYAMETLIADGSGAGQLQYLPNTVLAVQDDGTTSTFQITRSFTNESGSAITVKETGLVCVSEDIGSANHYFLLVRDVLSSSEVVADGQTLAVDYVLSTSI